MGTPINDLTGKTFGRLAVIRRHPENRYGRTTWECLCICGTPKIVPYSSLVNDSTHSCGCLQRELLSNRKTTHGLKKHPLYGHWLDMRNRCNNPKFEGYMNYGGRGIQVCERWNSFQNFYDDTISGFVTGLSLDRYPDVNANYGPGNFRWATHYEQSINRRNTVLIEFQGEMRTTSDIGRLTGLSRSMIEYRMKKRGMTLQQAIETPKFKRK